MTSKSNQPDPQSDHSGDLLLRTLGQRVLAHWQSSKRLPMAEGPNLLIFNPRAPQPAYHWLPEFGGSMGLDLKAGGQSAHLQWDGVSVAQTCSLELPLQSASLGNVILSHVVGSGHEPELREACRVLRPGGNLFMMGLNRIGFRYLLDGSGDTLPGLRPLAVKGHLEQFDMSVEMMLAAGFLRQDWPRQMNRGAARLFIPLADLLLIVARKIEPQILTPLTASRLRAVGASSAIAGS